MKNVEYEIKIQEIENEIQNLNHKYFIIKIRINSFPFSTNDYNNLINESIDIKNNIKNLQNKKKNFIKNRERKNKIEKINLLYDN